ARDVEGMKGKYLLEELEEDAEPLRNAGVDYVVTGSPVTRYEMFKAMTDGMMKSIIISILTCGLFLILVFHSVKDGVITILPVVLISTWVFGTMHLFGYPINVVTVTIAAMTIGVGVDYSIHVRQRYREERENKLSRNEAMDLAIQHSGRALCGAAATTALGFGVLYFSEMNIFSMYGLLSSLMIVYAFLGAIVVLPVLLMAGDGKGKREENS
ncbi:MAG: MMPL family transporter, partial [Thermoplasmata archaeon]|nr:MMPL family transporter [Thermoplasmata archaeon]